jgi:FixJ family two-component response regulator
MPEGKFIVFVVDDDESVRASLKLLIESSGYEVVTFRSAGDFLDSRLRENPSCCLQEQFLP